MISFRLCIWSRGATELMLYLSQYILLRSMWAQSLFATLWTIVGQAPLSMGFCREEWWSGLPCPPLWDLPHPGFKPASPSSPVLASGLLPPQKPPRKPPIKEHFMSICPITGDGYLNHLIKVQLSSVQSQSCPTLCDPMNRRWCLPILPAVQL